MLNQESCSTAFPADSRGNLLYQMLHLIKINQEDSWLQEQIQSKCKPAKESSFHPLQLDEGRANTGRLGIQVHHLHLKLFMRQQGKVKRL